MHNITYLDNFGKLFLYQKLTRRKLRPYLKSQELGKTIIAIGASKGSNPVGLALAEVNQETRSAELLSIFVLPSHRRCGIGTDLLSFLEQELLLQGYIKIKLECKVHKLTTPAFKLLLEKLNWSKLLPRLIECRSDYKMLNAPWLYNKYRFPSGMKIVPWEEITHQEHLVIEQTQQERPWIEREFLPAKEGENFEPLNSLGLRYQGQVVGWIITDRLDSDTILYKSMFVRKNLQKKGVGIALVVNAIQRQAQAQISKGIWHVLLDNLPMLNFVKKRMTPYLTSFDEISESSKLLIDT